MNYELLQKAVHFHGSQLVEALHAEQGDAFASNLSSTNVHEGAGTVTQCNLSSDRRKMLVSFIAQKADILFKKHRVSDAPPLKSDCDEKDYYAVMPPLECYMEFSDEARKTHFYESLKKGDVVIGTVSAKHTRGLIIELMCVSVGKMRDIHDLNLKCFCNSHQIPTVSAHEDPLESYQSGDLIQGLVLDVLPEMEKIYISMKDAFLPAHLQHQHIKLGIITDEDFPIHYRQLLRLRGNEKYEETLDNTLGFMNPSIVSHLSSKMGISLKRSESLMRGLHAREYAKEDFASEIYKVQCSKWAYKSVKQGVHYFKAGNTVEAFQCLNKALQIDPLNVEALVARGALYANNNSFSRAIDDFNKALESNPHHVNAGKFVVETLVAFGKQLEEQSSTDEAIKCYQKALLRNPNHSEAMYYMKSSQKKAAKQEKEKARQLIQDAEAAAKNHIVKEEQTVSVTKQKLKQLLDLEKEGKNINKRRRRSSSSTSTSSSKSSTSTSSRSSERAQSRKRKVRDRSTSVSSQSNSTTSTSSRSCKQKSMERDSKNRRYSSKSVPACKPTLNKVTQKSSSRRRFKKHSNAKKSKRHFSRKRGNKKDERQSRRKKKSSESESSTSDEKIELDSRRRKSNSSSSKSQPAFHCESRIRSEEKSSCSKNSIKPAQRLDSKTRREHSQPMQTDNNNSCASDMSFKSRSSATSYVARKEFSIQCGQVGIPSSSQEKEQDYPQKPKPEGRSQSLEELESFLASLKAGKNAKQSAVIGIRK